MKEEVYELVLKHYLVNEKGVTQKLEEPIYARYIYNSKITPVSNPMVVKGIFRQLCSHILNRLEDK